MKANLPIFFSFGVFLILFRKDYLSNRNVSLNLVSGISISMKKNGKFSVYWLSHIAGI